MDEHSNTGDTAVSMQAPLIANRYSIVGLLGVGGMGQVYRAYDLKLDETVALKMLRKDVLDVDGALERFRLEVKLARRVTSPHVVRTFDLGDHEGEHFLTMEYIDGRSLTRLLDDGPPPLDEVLRIARAACAGMVAAHAAGVLHRDLKPDNILVARDGRIAITDFGIARASADPARTGVEGMLGTPAYMAPEQVEGRSDLGPAADLYAFGAVLFEMLAGQRAWPGANGFTVAIARLHQPPPDPREHRPVPSRLAELVMRCLAREPEARPTDAAELGRALAAIEDAMSASASNATLVGIIADQPRPVVPAKSSRAVALFPLQATGELAEIADGLSEEIVDSLTMTRSLRVVPLASVRRAARAAGDIDPRDIGRGLNVDVVVEGSIRRRGDKARISARAIGVADGFQLWASHVDTDTRGLLSAGDDIARAIARALTVEIELPARAPAVTGSDGRATALYLEGKARLRASWFTTSLDGAISDLERAHALAPDDANILSTLSMALARHSFLSDSGYLPRARALAERAVAIAATSGEPWLALGIACHYEGAAADGAVALYRAIRRATGNVVAQILLGSVVLEAGAIDYAIDHLEAATALDPVQLPLVDLPRAYVYSGRYDDAMAMLARVDNPVSKVQQARFHLWRGDRVPLVADFSASPNEFRQFGETLTRYHATGHFTAEDYATIQAQTSVSNRRLRASRAQFFAEYLMFAGDHDGAMQLVDIAVEASFQDYLWMTSCPLLAPLRSRPRFIEVTAILAARAQEVATAIQREINAA